MVVPSRRSWFVWGAAGLLLFGCSSGGDEPSSGAERAADTTSSIALGGSGSQVSTTTTAKPTASGAPGEEFVAPQELMPVSGDGSTDPASVLPSELGDGLIIIEDTDFDGRLLLSIDLEPVSADLEDGANESVEIPSWPDRVWHPVWNEGDDLRVLDLDSGELTVFEDLELSSYNSQFPDGLWSVRRFLAVTQADGSGDETFLVDLEELTLTPTGGRLRYGGPSLSPDQRWMAVDADHGEQGPATLRVASTASPLDTSWSYAAPDGAVFVDSGSFDGAGNLRVQLRTVGQVRLHVYEGRVGTPLALVVEDELAIWQQRLPGLVTGVEDRDAVIVTDDGTRTVVGWDEPLGCVNGPVAALLREDRVRLIERDGSSTTDLPLDHPAPVGSMTLPADRIEVGGYDVYFQFAAKGTGVLVVDCHRRNVRDLVAELDSVTEEPGGAYLRDVVPSLSGTSAVVLLQADEAQYLLIVTGNGVRLEPLGELRVPAMAVSPTGEWLALATFANGRGTMEIRALETFELRAPVQELGDTTTLTIRWAPT